MSWNKGLKGYTNSGSFKKGENHPFYKGIKHNCIDCGKEIWPRYKRCVKCKNKGNLNPMYGKVGFKEFGENNPNWIDGRSFIPYPLGWTKTFKEQIRFRDGYACTNCGVPEIELSRKLHVHHKDCNKNNLNIDNLISLCGKCHIKEHYKLRGKK